MAEGSPNAPRATPRVLAIDDDRFMRAVIESVLTEAGIEVASVGPVEAARLIETEDFDLILCDRTMPEISGQEFLSIVRSKPRFDFTPFLFLTVSDETEYLVTSLGAGADDYITKPFNPSELVARVTSRMERARQVKKRHHGMLDIETFNFELEREATRAGRGGEGGVLAIVEVPSLHAVAESLGERERRVVLETIAEAMGEAMDPLDVIGATRYGDLAVLMPASRGQEAADRLREMATRAASIITEAHSYTIRPVPMIGFVEFAPKHKNPVRLLLERASQAAADAEMTQDLQPRRWVRVDESDEEKTDHRPGRETMQVVTSFLLGIVLPFFIYWVLDVYLFDLSWPVYIAVVVALVTTAALIWLEGLFASRHPGAPEVPGAPEPPASAIICAYLPNEAETIVETVEHFLTIDYPSGLEIILAYNTPEYLPVEDDLVQIALQNSNLLLLRVEHSNSKAQNLNAALARATGEFVGVFDADHHPDPNSFHRAWRWLSNGYDVVQGHCLVRNPEETFLSKMVAVEFESIYAVAHPGRWLRDGFGIFGGSNGYWKTEVLHMTRMRGSMLTEDIDASMRVIQAGGHIASDPDLISRELATTTAKQIWYQRLRWAQGWTQVSIQHLWRMVRLAHFDLRQKFGAFMLLFQREIYPWLSLQIFPLIAYWWFRGDVLDWFVPIFVAATIFATSVGPGMTWIAYRLSHPTIKRRSWFLQYALFATLIYTEAKNVIARVAHLKEALGESSWRVTPRSADPATASLPVTAFSALTVPGPVGSREADRLPKSAAPGARPLRETQVRLPPKPRSRPPSYSSRLRAMFRKGKHQQKMSERFFATNRPERDMTSRSSNAAQREHSHV